MVSGSVYSREIMGALLHALTQVTLAAQLKMQLASLASARRFTPRSSLHRLPASNDYAVEASARLGPAAPESFAQAHR